MTILFSVLHVMLGTAAAQVSTRVKTTTAAWEWASGIALIIGLSSFGVELARF